MFQYISDRIIQVEFSVSRNISFLSVFKSVHTETYRYQWYWTISYKCWRFLWYKITKSSVTRILWKSRLFTQVPPATVVMGTVLRSKFAIRLHTTHHSCSCSSQRFRDENSGYVMTHLIDPRSRTWGERVNSLHADWITAVLRREAWAASAAEAVTDCQPPKEK